MKKNTVMESEDEAVVTVPGMVPDPRERAVVAIAGVGVIGLKSLPVMVQVRVFPFGLIVEGEIRVRVGCIA